MPGHGGDDCSRDLFVVEPWGAVGQGTGRAGVPIELERPIDGDQDVPDPLPIVYDDNTSDVGGATNQTLTDTHHFDPPPDVDGPFPRAILTRELSDARVDPEALEGIDHDAGDKLEPLRDPGFGLILWCGPGECQCLLVENGRPTPGETFDRPKSVRSGDTNRLRVAGLNPIDGAEGHHGTRDVESDQTVDLPPGYSSECGMAHRDVESRMLWVGIGDECVSRHNPEDKEPGVTVNGSHRDPYLPRNPRSFAGNPRAERLVDKQY
jgi:hypothetical protein